MLGAAFWRQPATVIMWLRNGEEHEQVFATRYQAELYLAQLPALMAVLPHEDGAAAAMVSPLVAVGRGDLAGRFMG
jgi:hypothetical protein